MVHALGVGDGFLLYEKYVSPVSSPTIKVRDMRLRNPSPPQSVDGTLKTLHGSTDDSWCTRLSEGEVMGDGDGGPSEGTIEVVDDCWKEVDRLCERNKCRPL